MHPLWKKAAALGFLVFLALWVGGTLGDQAVLPPPSSSWPSLSSESTSRNFQQANNLAEIGLAKTPLPLVLDQVEIERIRVYEKNAQLALSTAAFDDDEAAIRSALAGQQATVFNERKHGIAPQRQLTLEIGVPPDKFDALVEQLRHIAYLESVNVDLRDRTAEFRRLHAQRQSLKKHLDAVLKLRDAKNPSIDDTLKLEQKIQDIEKELQAQNVNLGALLGKESFYNVHVTLSEYQPGSRRDRTDTLPRRLGNGFLWAVAWWFAVAAACGVMVGTYISIQTLWAKPPAKT